MSFPACVLTVRSGFSWRGGWVGGGVSPRGLTGYFDRKVGTPVSADLMFPGRGWVFPHTQERWGTAVTSATTEPRDARLPWPRGCVPRCHLVTHAGFLCYQAIFMQAGILYQTIFSLQSVMMDKNCWGKSMMGYKSTCLHHQSESV